MGEIPFLRYHEAGDRKSKVRVPGGGAPYPLSKNHLLPRIRLEPASTWHTSESVISQTVLSLGQGAPMEPPDLFRKAVRPNSSPGNLSD